MIHFVYIWLDKTRKMFYIGSHSGELEDGYLSSSRWLSGEIRYRPLDFKRRVIKVCVSREEAIQLEYDLISKILDGEFGTKYYNIKSGRKKGCVAWNKGGTSKRKGVPLLYHRGRSSWNKGIPMSDEAKQNLSAKNKGKEAWNKGVHNSKSADNGRRGASKLAQTVTGRKREYREDGTWFWRYPEGKE